MMTVATVTGTTLLAQQTSGIHLLMESLRTGGVVMFMIVLCSMAAVTVAIMTWMRLRESTLMPPAIISQLRALPTFAVKGDITPLHDVLVRDRSVLARLGLLAVSGQFTTKAECAEVVEQKAKEELHKLERDLPWLEVMVSVAPLLGLLGTTIGLVGMFTALGDTGTGPDMGAVAREIGVALRCTIAGLFVAVPSVIVHTYFVRKLDMIGVKLESILQEGIQNFYQHFEVQKTILPGNGDAVVP